MTTPSATLGTPVTDLDDSVVARQHSTCRSRPESSNVASEPHDPPALRRSWWIAPILVVVIVGAWMLGRHSLDPRSGTPGVATAPDGLTGFAELYVAAVLTGANESALRPLTVEPAAAQVAPFHRYVSRTAAIGLVPVAPDYWTITVAADVLPRTDGGYGPAAIEYFEVTVAVVGRRFLATGTPLPVPMPAATVPSGVYSELRTPGDEPTVAFVQEFVDAYLAGRGHIHRLVTPESGIGAVTPAPAATTEIASVKVGDIAGTTWATIVGSITDTDGWSMPITLSVRMVDAAAGVRIAEVLAGPPPLPRPSR